MSKHRDANGPINTKYGETPVGTLRKIYGQYFAAGYPASQKLSDVLPHLSEASLGQILRDHETGHLAHKIAKNSG
ncbi:hypothetical protein [Rhodopseudomonas sp. BAL398]|uniref:Uncharacterized protein n=1 Tax=Rhodopseudomonas palustris TaxID=1076 RepID=A0A0D7ELU7_RHOPL|nr:hypothetical protein [Rhodopseudomonas sp. BAL398]KIZ41789.1 hypothetical protein OO17_14185 [Rhodopseudomonas palustris]WOK19219.1 hypothetical protein RBJ75_06795 [Rhodopseudomonas sp. BAL398]